MKSRRRDYLYFYCLNDPVTDIWYKGSGTIKHDHFYYIDFTVKINLNDELTQTSLVAMVLLHRPKRSTV